MTANEEQKYIQVLQEELVTAMGCTEPIAVAYAAAVAKRYLGEIPDSLQIDVSGNILKNVKSVIVPNTGGLRGVETSAAAGIVAGDASRKLEVISEVTREQQQEIADYLKRAKINVGLADSEKVLDIQVTLHKEEHSAFVRITDAHTNITEIRKDGEIVYQKIEKADKNPRSEEMTDRSFLSVNGIVEFAKQVELSKVQELLDRQIRYNMQIADEGLHENYGANIGKTLLRTYGEQDVKIRAKAMAAAGSDARMNGCELPVVINSGSGNQGITASVPVIVYAEYLQADTERKYRALLISNLITVHLKTGIGRLSAYCGAVSAGCGCACGIAYLYGGGIDEIHHTIVNTLSITSGIICDGAKASCAAKIASAVDAGILGYHMYKDGGQFVDGDGLVKKGVENSIRNISRLAKQGMAETDREIIRMMIGQ